MVLAFFLITGTMNAQNVCISDVAHTADASAVLDVYSTSLGMLVPRLASAPTTPANGLLYYSTGSNSFFYNAGTSGTPSWTELSYGNLWSRSGTDTYLTNMGDNVVIGTNASPAPGVKFYIYGATSQVLQFDGKAEFFDVAASAGGNLVAEIDRIGAAKHGIINIYDGGATNTISLYSAGNSYFTGGNVGIGTTNPGTLLHVDDASGMAFPQLQIDETGLAGDASIGFGQAFTGIQYSLGIFDDPAGTDFNFKICNTPTLTGPGYADPNTMMEFHSENPLPGIVDLNHQSRARAFQGQNFQKPFRWGQPIPGSIWTPVDFDNFSYDEHGEFNLASPPPYSGGGGPAAAYFTATEEGYYQVNARVDFWLYDYETEEDYFPANDSGYVSIAIVKSVNQQNYTMYAQGNKLQGSNVFIVWEDEVHLTLPNNLAPNVSDVVYMLPGEEISIWVWQSIWNGWGGAGGAIPLRVGPNNEPGLAPEPRPSQCYVSIHKSS